MMKGRTTNSVQSNRSTKNGERDQKTQKMNGAKQSSEQERLKLLEVKEQSKVSEVLSVITTRSNHDDEDVANGSSDHYQESETSRIAEKTMKDECANGSVCVLVKEDDDDVGERKEFDTIVNAKTDSVSFSEICDGVNVDKRGGCLVKEVEDVEDTSNGGISGGSENEAGDDVKENSEDEEVLKQKVENLETRIEKLEEELREVAALEISLYSVVPDHSSSAHKLHTPARRISRLYIHSCKHWRPEKRATVARNSVSGLILAAKSCGNDVSR